MIGQDVYVGDLRVHVLWVRDLGHTIDGRPRSQRDVTIAGSWIRIRLDLEYMGSDVHWLWQNLKVVDSEGRSYPTGGDWIKKEVDCPFNEFLEPHVVRGCDLIFEVAPGAKDLKLKFDQGFFQKDSTVYIPLGIST